MEREASNIGMTKPHKVQFIAMQSNNVAKQHVNILENENMMEDG